MNNILMSLKRFLKNKNTVTILGIALIAGIIVFAYDQAVKTQTNPVKVVVAKETIQPRTQITEEMVEVVDMPAKFKNSNVLGSLNLVIGKEASYNTVIPAGSMIFKDAVLDPEEQPDSPFGDIDEGDVPYEMSIDIEGSYGNSIMPGHPVDLYMKAYNDEGQLMVGKLIENIEITAVKDNQGLHVFENSDDSNTRKPAQLIFGVKPELFILLKKAQYMTKYQVEIFPVPHAGSIDTTDLEVEVTSENLKEFINSHTAANDDLIDGELNEVDENTDENLNQ